MKKITIREIAFTAIFTALIAIGAFIRIPVPYVPFTLQFFFTMLAGLLLGARLGTISVAMYVLLGLVGLPIFTQGGGFHYIFIPTFGYILGFCGGTFVTGKIAEGTSNPTFKRLLAANFAGLAVVYLAGTAYFYLLSNFYLNEPIELWTAILYCIIFPISGDILLSLLAAQIGKKIIPMVRKEYLR